ncbi:MAG: CPBP family intramembrane metalloprotease [Lachnospiraceae bacterium]|nr:CPBP family intramembrane metalloprotease [Lachnospiraceae bacterium]
MSTKKEKKSWQENEAPLGRWIGTAILALILGAILGGLMATIMNFIPLFDDGMILAPFKGLFFAMIPFACFFVASVLSIRWLCRTSLRSFFFGRDRKPDIKRALVAGLLMLAGILLSEAPNYRHFSLDNNSVSIIAVNFIFCLLFVWIQTTTEEIFFRGFFLRAPYRNEVPALPRGLLFAFISSLFFMAAHLSNPEVTTLSFGADMILGAASYFVVAFAMYISNLLIGGMEAGLVFHWVNNFYCFFLVRQKVSAVETPTIFVNNADAALGTTTFIQGVVMYLPPLIYLICVYRKRRAKTD